MRGDVLVPAAPTADDRSPKAWHVGAIRVLVVSESRIWRAEMAGLLEADGYSVRFDDRWDAIAEPGCTCDIAVVDFATCARPATAVAGPRPGSSIPILAVSQDQCGESALLEAYAAGVDQLVTRSVRPRELMARVRALLRRHPPRERAAMSSEDAVRDLSVDVATGVATVAGAQAVLSPRESEVLSLLLQRPGRVVTRELLAGSTRGRYADRALDGVVRGLRTKLERLEGHRRIMAVRGVGFRLLPDRELSSRDNAGRGT